ncbi:hypothetical protein BGZ96_000198, partial [Linnemannia gamsii]
PTVSCSRARPPRAPTPSRLSAPWTRPASSPSPPSATPHFSTSSVSSRSAPSRLPRPSLRPPSLPRRSKRLVPSLSSRPLVTLPAWSPSTAPRPTSSLSPARSRLPVLSICPVAATLSSTRSPRARTGRRMSTRDCVGVWTRPSRSVSSSLVSLSLSSRDSAPDTATPTPCVSSSP